MIIALWIFTLIGIALWSLAAWALHALLTIDPAALGALDPWIARIPFADLIERWYPAWQDTLRLAIDGLQAALGWVGGAAPVVVWVVWGIGTAAALAIGGLLTLLVKLVASELAPKKPAVTGAAAG